MAGAMCVIACIVTLTSPSVSGLRPVCIRAALVDSAITNYPSELEAHLAARSCSYSTIVEQYADVYAFVKGRLSRVDRRGRRDRWRCIPGHLRAASRTAAPNRVELAHWRSR